MKTNDSEIMPEGYKITELGALPEEWKVVRVGEVFEFSKKPKNLKIQDNDLIPFISMEMISETNQSMKFWEEKRYSDICSGSFVFKGDIIIAKITPSFENGKQAILDELPSNFGYATTEIWALHPKNEKVITQHLYYYLKNDAIRMALAGKMEGSTGRQRLARHALEDFYFPLPPLAEQQKIAAVLSAVQEAKEKTEAVIAATKALKKSMMKHLFTYGPVSPEEAENVQLKETEIGPVPEDWEVVKFDSCINKQNSKLEKIKKQEYNLYGRYPVIDQGQDLIAGYWDNEKDVYKKNLPVIIFGDHTRIIKYIDFPFVTGADGTKILVPNTSVVFPRFFYYSLLNLKIPSRGYNRHYSLLRDFKIPLPPLPIQ
ncbi:MAG TPA: restriction endonuclease subunit S, partial [Methanofastidiosum sp.]|nr:restriction endonuclease subunit S [Methanofastidiosum sp.]